MSTIAERDEFRFQLLERSDAPDQAQHTSTGELPLGEAPSALNDLMEAALLHPPTAVRDSVLCLLEAVGLLWITLRPDATAANADDLEVARSCMRAASVSLRSHLWGAFRGEAESSVKHKSTA